MLVFITGPMVVGATTCDRDVGHTFHFDLHVVPRLVNHVERAPSEKPERSTRGTN